ncbi:pirin family protein [Hymenobacter metallilatus]|uniref:Quercetin 2,3-dioxygenase C-terminal cupin domain-containing protein n=1 Tax=Hymenobacter metallilatus TaxID=2493666 RepID=A0A3R9UMT3_9BACT|nr:hypothetical protein [Hymenobacter metallilatus]RSK35490.1 hypothetical protein EI290_07275 [Hymenobacter metallilatus]
MTLQIPGRLYLADQHGTLTTPQSSRRSVFSFGPYQDAQRPAAGRLLALNEETLAGGHQLVLPASQAAHCLVLPLTGAVGCGDALSQELVQVEAVWAGLVSAGHQLVLSNPYAEEAVSFLHIWLALDASLAAQPQATTVAYTFQQVESGLAELVSTPDLRLSLGRFGGRQEDVYRLHDTEALFFAYVLAGAFEVEGRLLHPNDGLALWQVQQVELEALSNNALVLVLEVSQ